MSAEQREQTIEALRLWLIPEDDGGYLYKQRISRMMAERVFDAVVAPLLVEAERHGLEQGWDEGYGAGRDDEADGPLLLHDTTNPYRSPEPT